MEPSKFPRIFHFPDSPGATSDDKRMGDYSCFTEKRIVATLKMDGECTNFYTNCFHARSTGMPSHPSQSIVKAIWSKIRNDIPENMKICGENCYAKHSIHYANLPDWFVVFGIVQDDCFLSREKIVEWCELFELTPSKILHEGTWDTKTIVDLAEKTIRTGIDGDEAEGIVVWNADGFKVEDFQQNVGKWVRTGHVAPDSKHWRTGPIVANELRR